MDDKAGLVSLNQMREHFSEERELEIETEKICGNIAITYSIFKGMGEDGKPIGPIAEIQFGPPNDPNAFSYGHAFLIGEDDQEIRDLDEILQCWGIGPDEPVWEVISDDEYD